MWANYSTKDAAQVVGLAEATVRTCAREGLLDTPADELPLRYNFRDIQVLRTLKSLANQGVGLRRARRQLIALKAKEKSSLASLHLATHRGQVVVRRDGKMWNATDGQLIFEFQFENPEGQVESLCDRVTPTIESLSPMDADEWFALALQCEEEDANRAKQAYRQVLIQRPSCTESMINLGRLLAEEEALDEAEVLFRAALEVNPNEPTALYNLGVIAQDAGDDEQAIEFYEAALRNDRELAEAHYNLATIFDKTGDARAAIRHINEFRKLNRRRP